MGRFRNKEKKQPEIPTSALPDIIFILLFFFMVTTKMKENDPKVKIDLTTATQVKKIPQEYQKITFMIGPMKSGSNRNPVIQVNNEIIQPHEIERIVGETLGKMDQTKRSVTNIIAYIKVDKELKMGLVKDVTSNLRKVGVLNLIHSARDKE